MLVTYPQSAWEELETIKADDLDGEELKKMRRQVEDLLRKNKEALFLTAAILRDHGFLNK